MRTDDAQLVDRVRSGESEAFEMLVEKYRDAVSAVCYTFLGDFDDVQDAAQEAFVQAYLRLSSLRDTGKFGPWVREIAANVCRQMIRAKKPLVALEDSAQQSLQGDEPRCTAVRMIVREALSKLSEKTRLTVTLACINGYSHYEIASFLEVPLNTVRSRLRIAKSKLREEMIEMVSDSLHMDKPGEELACKIVDYVNRIRYSTTDVAVGEVLRLCDDALAAIQNLSSGGTSNQIRKLLIGAVESEENIPGGKTQALHNLKTWTPEEIIVREEAEILLAKGKVLLQLEDVEGAKRLFDQAFELITGINNGEALKLTIDTVANSCYIHHQNLLAREYLLKAVEYARNAGDLLDEGMNTWKIANTHLDDGKLALARPFAERARDLFTNADEPGLATMVQAAVDLIDDIGEERWKSVDQWLTFSLALRKTADGIEITDRGRGYTSNASIPHLTLLWDAVRYVGMDSSKASGTCWSEHTHWRIPHDWPVTTTTTIVGYNESVITPAGAFSDCMLIEEVTVEDGPPANLPENVQQTLRSCVFGTRRYWFARGVGLVHFILRNNGGDQTLIKLNEYEIRDPSDTYLPLAIGNTWAYSWIEASRGYIANEKYKIAANDGEHWYLENHRCIYKQSLS